MLLRRQHENGLLFRRVLHRNARTRRNHKVIRQPNSELRTDLGTRAAELVVELSVDIFDKQNLLFALALYPALLYVTV